MATFLELLQLWPVSDLWQ